MKIALINNLYGRYSRGGAEQIVKKIAQGLQARGAVVFIISSGPFSSLSSLKFSSDIEDNIKVYRFYPLNTYFYGEAASHGTLARIIWTLFDLFNIQSARQIRKILAVEKADLILLHNLKGLGYLIPRALKKLPAKVILTLHDVQLVNPSGLIIKGGENDWLNVSFLAKAYQSLCRWLFKDINYLVSPSRFLLNFYLEKGFFKQAKKIVLPNPAIFTQGVEGSLAEAKHQFEFKETGHPIKLLFIGQIEKHKGIHWLLDFLKKENFSLSGKPLVLEVVGQGKETENLKRLYPQAQWLGQLNHEQIKKIISLSDYLIFPTLCYENSPTVIYEALSLGLPVIASDIGGVSELVKTGENGFLFEAGDSRQFKKVLEQAVLLDKNDYQKLSNQAKESVSLYTIENYLVNLLAL